MLVFVAAASAALGQTTHNDDSCDIAVTPAATLLLPYFEVDLADRLGHTTMFSVTNVTDTAHVARVTLWTDYAYPIFSFNIYLTGYDVQTINLHDVLNGRITNRRFGTGEWVSVHGDGTKKNPTLDRECGRIADVIPDFDVERMKIAFTHGIVPGCFNVGHDHENAVGYATIDVVGNCGSALPTDPTYFTEDIRFDNVLIGDYQQVTPDQDFAQGAPMVHIRAIGGMRQGQFVTNLSHTFYGRLQNPSRPKADGRQPLPSTFAGRWINGGQGGFETSMKVWREGVTTASAVCKDYERNSLLTVNETVVFDEDGNGEGLSKFVCQITCVGDPRIVLPATSQVSIADSEVFGQQLLSSERAGWVYLNLRGDTSPTVRPRQAWVVMSMRAEGRYSIDVDASGLANGCTGPTPVTEFSEDGVTGIVPGPGPDVIP